MRADITRARKRARLTQAQVAKAINKTQSAVSRYEAGELPIPIDVAPKLERLIGIPAMRLLYPTRRRRKEK